MYADFYGFSERPFRLSPDFHFFFGGRPHKRAMAYLTYGLSQREGFVVITGEVGAGKTTLIDYLLSSINPSNLIAAKIATTQLDADDILRTAAFAFGIDGAGIDKATLIRRLEEFLFSQARAGHHLLLVVDESQNLGVRALEELRMLSNFQLGERALLQIYLIGQPQFREVLASDQCEQLRQRVIASYHLAALDGAETRAYVEHRMRHVGWKNDPSFDDDVFRLIFEHTGGIPRKINLLCDRLLLCGYLDEKHHIDVSTAEEVLVDLHDERSLSARARSNVPLRDSVDDVSTEAAAIAKEVVRLFNRTPELRSALDASSKANDLLGHGDAVGNGAGDNALSEPLRRTDVMTQAGLAVVSTTERHPSEAIGLELAKLAANAASLEECLQALEGQVKRILGRLDE